MLTPLLFASPLNVGPRLPALAALTSYTFFYSTFALLGAAVFFILERRNVPRRWRANLTVAGLICLIAATSYLYMQIFYVGEGIPLTRFRYTE